MSPNRKDQFSSSAYVRKTNDQDVERRIRAQHEYRHAPPAKKTRTAPVRVLSVEPRSLAGRIGLEAGDEVLEINGQPLLDVVDFQFRMASFGERMSVRTRDRTFRFVRREWESLGAEFEPIEPLVCDNDCVFCFVHQNPGNTRRSLRIKDEDYRLSFLFGNYLTLTNVADAELDRIIAQRLSPLYISVHATEPRLRARMLGNETYDGLDGKLDRLSEAGIRLHCQVVLCPGWNDGVHLERTIDDLARRYPSVQSVAVVPVGLTDHRENLPRLDPVTPEYARLTIDRLDPVQKDFEARIGTPFVFLGDEFYIQAGRELPGSAHYVEFPQIENGVGMVRAFLDEFLDRLGTFPVGGGRLDAVVATGTLFEPYLREAIDQLGLGLRVVGVENRFWGGGIRVAGLLTGSDFVAACREVPSGLVILPSESMIGDAGLFLDDMTLSEVEQALGRPVVASGYTAGEFLDVLQELLAGNETTTSPLG
jgi:putative radical SAM enzyme (TIGR03279 family)